MRWPDPIFRYRQLLDIGLSNPILMTSFAGPIENKQSISVRRALLGGQTRAELSVHLINNKNDTQQVLWLETMPWFINFYIHTLTATIGGSRMGELASMFVTQHAYNCALVLR